MLLGGPSDQAAAASLRAAVPRASRIDLVGQTDLLTCFSALKHARLFIGGDSGLMHLAAAAGAPTLGLFGPSDERLYAPWGAQARTVRGPRTFEQIRQLDPGLKQAICHMMELRVASVMASARSLIADTQAGRAPPRPPGDAHA